MRSLKARQKDKLDRLVENYQRLHIILAKYYHYLQLANRAHLKETMALFENKVLTVEAEIKRLEKKITRLKRKIKEKN